MPAEIFNLSPAVQLCLSNLTHPPYFQDIHSGGVDLRFPHHTNGEQATTHLSLTHQRINETQNDERWTFRLNQPTTLNPKTHTCLKDARTLAPRLSSHLNMRC